MAERVTIMTSDAVELAGHWEMPDGARAAALLLHMMPATKESWSAFSSALARRGVASLAIDLRGHGESVRRGDETLAFQEFEDVEHQAKRLDAEASADWMAAKGFAPSSTGVCGASIGANLAIRLLADRPALKAVIALSPGGNYRGVDAMDGATRLNRSQKLLLVASSEDAYSFESVGALAASSTAGETTVDKFEGLGHGTNMLERSPEFLERAADWLAQRLV